jgi:hypothetical protein
MCKTEPFLRNKRNTARNVVLILVMMTIGFGCAAGPAAISMGRSQYNEVITRTDNEQLLMAIIRNRYAEPYNILTVTNVAANLRFGANAGVNVGLGSADSYSGKLVPFRAGVVYEENPTISYTPARGRDFLRRLYSPIPLKLLILTLRATLNPELQFRLLVKQVKDMRNPAFLDPTTKHD